MADRYVKGRRMQVQDGVHSCVAVIISHGGDELVVGLQIHAQGFFEQPLDAVVDKHSDLIE